MYCYDDQIIADDEDEFDCRAYAWGVALRGNGDVYLFPQGIETGTATKVAHADFERAKQEIDAVSCNRFAEWPYISSLLGI